MSSYIEGFEDGVRATKAEYLKLLKEESHPEKELTDEEILIVWISSNFVRYTETGHIDEIFFNKFARAILRKAQEK
jgi:hypothetical protein